MQDKAFVMCVVAIIIGFVVSVGYVVYDRQVGFERDIPKSVAAVEIIDSEGKQVIDADTTERFLDIFNMNLERTHDDPNMIEGKALNRVRVGYVDEGIFDYNVYDDGKTVTFIHLSSSAKFSNRVVELTGKDAEFAKLVVSNDAKANTFSWSTK